MGRQGSDPHRLADIRRHRGNAARGTAPSAQPGQVRVRQACLTARDHGLRARVQHVAQRRIAQRAGNVGVGAKQGRLTATSPVP